MKCDLCPVHDKFQPYSKVNPLLLGLFNRAKAWSKIIIEWQRSTWPRSMKLQAPGSKFYFNVLFFKNTGKVLHFLSKSSPVRCQGSDWNRRSELPTPRRLSKSLVKSPIHGTKTQRRDVLPVRSAWAETFIGCSLWNDTICFCLEGNLFPEPPPGSEHEGEEEKMCLFPAD